MNLRTLFSYSRRLLISLGLLIGLLLGLAIAIALQKPSSNGETSGPATFPSSYSVGVWSWKSPDTYSHSDMQNQATELKKLHISTVYTDISSYADYTEITDPAEKQRKITALTAALEQFVATFHGNGIEVRALAGNETWGNPDYQHLPEAILAYTADYNASASPNEQLAGLQFDIEYYNDPSFQDDKKTNIIQYLSLTNGLIAQQLQQDEPFPLGFTVPYWFDNENGNAPRTTFGGTTKSPTQHVIDQLNILSNGYITVMSYRNEPEGNDGVIKHAHQEIDYADTKARTKVYIGLETTDVQPEKITFHSKTKSDLITAATQVYKEFGTERAFSGFTINDSEGLLQL